MKKLLCMFLCFALAGIGSVSKVMAQAQELEQLTLDIEKLAQFKQILSDMKKGYDILDKGYSTIKAISQGSFDLHQGFLTGLLVVSPQLRNYGRIGDIIKCQGLLLSEYKSAYGNFKSSGRFTPEEISYLGTVYKNLFDRSLNNLNELTTILTDSQLRMSDDERLKQIDRIDTEMQDKLSFLRSFNKRLYAADTQRKKQQQDTKKLQQLYGNP
jgi:hypothetical protein